MPRNRCKTRCQFPGCHNWAMRGHTLCRAHADATFGPRGVGALPANLNALKTAKNAHPLAPEELHLLSHAIAADPAHLPDLLLPALRSIHARTKTPDQALLSLRAALTDLLALITGDLFAAELHASLDRYEPQRRAFLERTIWTHALRYNPEDRLLLLRGIIANLPTPLPPTESEKNHEPEKQ
jgi:hypothetical protein